MKAFQFKSLAYLAAALVLGAFSGCGKGEESGSEGIEVSEAPEQGGEIFLTHDQFNTMEMVWGNPLKEEFASEINVQGMVQVPVEGMQEVSAYFGGYVSGMKLLEGQQVRKGEILFYLENPDFIRLQQDYLETFSQLAYLKAEFERNKTLYGEQISAQKNLLKAEADYQSALAKTNSLKQQLCLINIQVDQLTPENIRSKVPVFSPISGFVEHVFVVPGAFLPASGKAVSLLNKDHLHIELYLFEKDAPRVHVGQKAEISLPDALDRSLLAEVYLIGQSISAERQINVHAHVLDKKEEQSLIPGTFVQARVQLDPKESWTLPEDAVVEVDGDYFVLIQKEKTEQGYRLATVQVTPGDRKKARVAFDEVAGLDDNAVVLVKGGFNLL